MFPDPGMKARRPESLNETLVEVATSTSSARTSTSPLVVDGVDAAARLRVATKATQPVVVHGWVDAEIGEQAAVGACDEREGTAAASREQLDRILRGDL